jgi:hypothetical protein
MDTVGEFVSDLWKPRIRLAGTPHRSSSRPNDPRRESANRIVCYPKAGAACYFAIALATAFLIASPRMPRATILPSGPTRTKAGIARMPNRPGIGPWMPPPR